MFILAIGDTHTDLHSINVAIDAMEKRFDITPDLVLQVGDFGFYKDYGGWKAALKGLFKFRLPTIVVHGNHENEASARAAMGEFGSLVPNFKCLKEGGEYYEFTKNGETVRIFGVGGAECVDSPPRNEYFAFNLNDYTEAFSRWQDISKPPPAIDILMTHECPKGVGMKGNPRIAAMFGLPPNMECGDISLTRLWHAMRPRLQINGHHHRLHEYVSPAGLRHLTLPVSQVGFAVINTSDWSYTNVGVRRQ